MDGNSALDTVVTTPFVAMQPINVLLTTPNATTLSLHLPAPTPSTPLTASAVLAAAPSGVCHPFTYLLRDGRAVPPQAVLLAHAAASAAVGPASGPLCLTARHRVGILGGKGGFGALLRGATAATKTTNFDSCRDLRGRRLRDVVAGREAAAARAAGRSSVAAVATAAESIRAAGTVAGRGGGSGGGGGGGGGGGCDSGGGGDGSQRDGKRRRVEVRVDFDEDALDEECHAARRRAREALYAGMDGAGGGGDGASAGGGWGGGEWDDDDSSSGDEGGGEPAATAAATAARAGTPGVAALAVPAAAKGAPTKECFTHHDGGASHRSGQVKEHAQRLPGVGAAEPPVADGEVAARSPPPFKTDASDPEEVRPPAPTDPIDAGGAVEGRPPASVAAAKVEG
ncbi:hypothetical protein MMPV_005270 [Pyropia vietnamensis]